MPASGQSRVILALIITIVLWASAFAVIRSAAHAYSPTAMALLRFGIASVALGMYVAVSRPPLRLKKPTDIWPLLACGALGVTIYHPLLNYGEQVVPAGTASLLINSSPVWTALLAIPVLGEKLTTRKALGILLGFTGVSLIALGKPDASGNYFTLNLASLAIIGSAVCSACYVVVQKKFLAGYSAIQFTCWNIWLGTLLLLPIALWDLMTNITKVPWQPTLEIVYLGIFPGALAYLAFAYATQRLPAARVMSFLYLVAPLAILMAWPYLKELPSLLSLTGGAIAIAGVALVNTGQSKRTATPAIAVEEA